MTQTLQKIVLYTVVIGMIAVVLYSLYQVNQAHATDATTIPATIATSSLMVVGPQSANTLFATSTCTSRVITTYANPVMLTFSENQGNVPTAVYGHLQSASTTVAYDAGLYGCGKMKAYGYTASTSITVTEAR